MKLEADEEDGSYQYRQQSRSGIRFDGRQTSASAKFGTYHQGYPLILELGFRQIFRSTR